MSTKVMVTRARRLGVALVCVLASGCAQSLTEQEKDQMREAINEESELIIEALSEHHPQLSDEIEQAAGYATATTSNIKLPLVGGGQGVGAVYHADNGSITYVDVHRYELGAGLGMTSYQTLSIFDDTEQLESFSEDHRVNHWWGTQAMESLHEDQGVMVIEQDNLTTYVMYDTTSTPMAGAGHIKVSKNEQLTETGLGNAWVANHVEESSDSYQKWDRALPFFAQDVIDQGFMLPKPLGISLLYAETRQDMSITDIEVGHSFFGDGRVPVNNVVMDNNYSHSQSPQLKLDAWVFPFMNVFATVGKVNGMAHVEFAFDDQLIDGFESAIDKICRPGPVGPDCDGYNGLDNLRGFHGLDVNLDGWNYTLGATFASGWRDYFLAIPVSVTYVDMKHAKAEELVINASMRVGKQLPLKGSTSVDVYGGVSYLDSTLTIEGQHYFGGTTENALNYKIKQENDDKWMGLLGASYNFNRSWSVQGEFGQYTKDKRQVVTSLTHRF